MVDKAWEYMWSSAGWHVGIEKELSVKVGNIHNYCSEEWEEYLMEEDHEMIDEVRLKTQRGLAIGSAKFINSFKRRLNRSLICLNPGRSTKEVATIINEKK